MLDGWKVIGAFLFLICVVALFVSATNYNTDSQKTCESVGQTMVRVYPHGEFGCANVTPFNEVPK